MSVLSRPVRHRAPAPTQRELRIPLPRDASPAEAAPRTEPAGRTPAPRPSAPTARRRIPAALLAVGLVGALAIAGGTTYVLTDDDGGGGAASVIAPAYVPTDTDLARDAATAARGAGSTSVGLNDTRRVTEAQRDAATQQRARNVQP